MEHRRGGSESMQAFTDLLSLGKQSWKFRVPLAPVSFYDRSQIWVYEGSHRMLGLR